MGTAPRIIRFVFSRRRIRSRLTTLLPPIWTFASDIDEGTMFPFLSSRTMRPDSSVIQWRNSSPCNCRVILLPSGRMRVNLSGRAGMAERICATHTSAIIVKIVFFIACYLLTMKPFVPSESHSRAFSSFTTTTSKEAS